ncbi:hypothetical protein BRETT_003271 [Brettanomyces bruxellensis]|uniref:Altered inheritance rate of mitochondria protein 29 n=1 Tax=Dekkera bruxellensis TaxID=5007 RepID=A0A871RMT8_DEKBR|nr:uncharacterized protein BRETT_003271 [Brettanomyces bruxellensis]QOU23080.1 hypothetical protein BRETT_003271 [Brettanomyces bruxellensis]
MSDFDLEEPLTSTARPCKNVRNQIFHHVDLENTTPKQFYDMIMHEINSQGSLRPFRNVHYDTIKIYTHAHGHKTMNLVINMDHDDDDWVLEINNNQKKLSEYPIENETELSIYNKQDYLAYKKKPVEKW